MYTRCPKCETCFRVTDRHLAIARGKVRCGKCQLVFNAIENAIDDLPGNSAATQATTKLKSTASAASLNTSASSSAPQAAKTRTKAEAIKTPPPVAEQNTTKAKATTKNATEKVKPAAVKQEKTSAVPHPKIAPPLYKASSSHAKQDHHDAFHMDNDSFDENFDLDAAIDKLSHAAEEVTYDFDSTSIIEEPTHPKKEPAEEVKSEGIFSTDAYDETNASSVADILNEMEGQLSLNIDSPAQPVSDNYDADADDEFEFIELGEKTETEKHDNRERTEESHDELTKSNVNLDEPGLNDAVLDDFDLDDALNDINSESAPGKEPGTKQATQAHEDRAEDSAEDFLEQFEALDVPAEKIKEKIIIADPTTNEDPSLKIGEHSDSYEVPYQLREDVDRLNAASGRRLHPVFKLLLLVLLLMTSFSQLAYFRAYELVNIIPESRAILETFCETVGCQYSGPSDTKQIELVSRDVRLHPKEKNALLISAVMINNAYFAQPYPNIHIRLSDISGNVVAERIFNPETYMGKLSNPFLLMRSKTPVHINFEVVDPGKDAVNFEFTFL